MLVMDLYCSEHPIAKKLMNSKVVRSIKKNRSEIARAVFRGIQRKPHYTGAGLYLGDYPSFPIDGERVNEMIRTMIRGLYFDRLKKRLPSNYDFDIRRQDQLSVKDVFEHMKKAKANGPYTLGNVFGYQLLYGDEDPGITCWYLGFYDGFFLRVNTFPSIKLVAAQDAEPNAVADSGRK